MSKQFEHQRESRRGDWHCLVQQEPWNLTTKVYLIKHKGNGHADMASIENGNLTMRDIKLVDDTKPLFELPYDAWQTILGIMGSTTPSVRVEVTDAELKATKYHLEDLRKLVFKEVPNESKE